MPFADVVGLGGVAVVARLVEAEVRGRWGQLAPFETPKDMAFLTADFTIGNDLVTPTLKVRRRLVEEQYRSVIEAMYGEEASDDVVRER